VRKSSAAGINTFSTNVSRIFWASYWKAAYFAANDEIRGAPLRPASNQAIKANEQFLLAWR
jgi:hypothetical protein